VPCEQLPFFLILPTGSLTSRGAIIYLVFYFILLDMATKAADVELVDYLDQEWEQNKLNKN